MRKKEDSDRSSIRAYLAWFSISLFFFYQYILRVSPGVMYEELSLTFNLTTEQFASLGAYYLYTCSLLQIPLGLLIDRVGVRPTILGSILLCMLGTLSQAIAPADQFWIVQLSRILIGLGSATAFMGALKVAADYLPAGRRALLMGATLSLGTIGALMAGKPLVYFLDLKGWRYTLLLTLVVGLVVFVMNAIILPKEKGKAKESGANELKHFWQQIGAVFKNRPVILYAILAIGVYTPLSALADLWGTTFLKQKFMLARADAAQISMMMYMGLAVGSLILPWLSERYNALNRGIQICEVMLLVCFVALLYLPTLSLYSLISLLFLMGLFCGGEMMCFTGAALYTTRDNSGVTMGVVNTLNMLGGAILQHIIGLGLDWQWSGAYDTQGIRSYTTEQFVFALSLMLAVIGICVVLSFRLGKKEKVAYSA